MKLATIEKIESILPHDNATSLEIAIVQGWRTVVKKGQFEKGETVVFIPIDTVLTPSPWNSFLHHKDNPDKPIRVKTVALRGQYSQGLVFPLEILPPHGGWSSELGTDVSNLLGVSKYEKTLPAELCGDALGAFPSQFASKTDEDNVLSHCYLLQELKDSGKGAVATLKWDGSSMTVILSKEETGNKLMVCSRNLNLKESDSNTFWKVARDKGFSEKLTLADHIHGFRSIAIQGELVGPGINKNQPKLLAHDFVLFNARITTSTGSIELGHADLVQLGLNLDIKVADQVKTWTAEEVQTLTLQDLQALANTVKYPSGSIAEGLVIRPLVPVPSERIRKNLSFKIINQAYND